MSTYRTYETSSASSAWFRVFRPRPEARVRLVCFPHAGGAASAFRTWTELLPPTVELVAVQYPGRQDRFHEPALEDMDVLVDRLSFAAAHRLRGPVAFFGHSLGATVAYEVARRLAGRQPEVVRLFASARSAPSVDRRHDLTFPDDDALLDYIRALGGTGAGVLEDRELQELALPTLRSDFRLVAGYRSVAGEQLTCPITAIAGDADASFTLADAEQWRRHTSGTFSSVELSGGHFYIEDVPEDLVRVLVGELGVAAAV
ncbi:thioesterase II family protein [Streptomyces sp. NPDC001816]|uniref:thioesterase II family protein n=1 Tax=Streptomyces sp. NPDC001816 TaxID=3364612 RepID=UPI0036B11A49